MQWRTARSPSRESLNDPFSLGLTLYFASAVAQVLGDVALAAQHAEASMQLATEHDLAMLKAWSTGVVGWCAATIGDPDRGIALLDRSDRRIAGHAIASFPVLSARIVGGSAHRGRASIGSDESGGRRLSHWPNAPANASTARNCTACMVSCSPNLSMGQPEKAEDAFRMAIKIAKQQGALSLERKANESLRRWVG